MFIRPEIQKDFFFFLRNTCMCYYCLLLYLRICTIVMFVILSLSIYMLVFFVILAKRFKIVLVFYWSSDCLIVPGIFSCSLCVGMEV